MFYSDVILSKRGPLARVWLAAHWERKISKTQFLQTSIEKSVGAIVSDNGVPMALRLSGQLLLGVVRIYSRKAKYLLEDCNEALLKIKMAFRTGNNNVDLTTNQLTVSRAAITMLETRTEFDLRLPDPFMQNWDMEIDFNDAATALRGDRDGTPGSSGVGRGAHTAKEADITLPHNNFGLYDDDFGIDAGYDYLIGDGIDSHDYDPDGGALDLGLDVDEPPRAERRDTRGHAVDANGDPVADRTGDMDDSMSIGVGRDAAPMRDRSLGSLLGFGSDRGGDQMSIDGQDRTGDLPILGAGEENWGFNDGEDQMFEDFPPEETEMPDLFAGRNIEEGEDDRTAMEFRLARSMTPASQIGDNSMALLQNITPNTLNKMKAAAAHRMALASGQTQMTQRGKKVIVDDVIEVRETAAKKNQSLAQSAALNRRPDSIVKQGELLASDPVEIQYAAIEKNPLAHYLPEFQNVKETTTVYLGPELLGDELRPLFTFDLALMRKKQAEADQEYRASNKRKRTQAAAEDEDLLSEVGRRASNADRTSVPFDDTGAGGHADFDAWDQMPDEQEMPDLFAGRGELFPEDRPQELGLLEEDTSASPSKVRRSLRGRATGDQSELGRLPTLGRLETPDLDSLTFQESQAATAGGNVLGAFESRAHDSAAAPPLFPASQQPGANPNSTAGWSRNTVRALHVVRGELADTDEQTEADAEADKSVSFQQVSDKSSRRAAAAFFFELLVLGTKDCVKLQQEEPYGDIEVKAKNKLWEIEVVEPPRPATSAPVMSSAAQASQMLPPAQTTPRSKGRRTPASTPRNQRAGSVASRATPTPITAG